MLQTTSINQITSPFGTGGGGVTLHEQPVNAYYLAALLLQTVPRGQNVGVTHQVRLQRFFEGEALDDLVILSESQAGTGKISLQLKNDLAFGERDAIFDAVMRACWETFTASDFDPIFHHFGVGVGTYKSTYEGYQAALSWARHSANASDFHTRISTPRFSSAAHREIEHLARTKITNYAGRAATDDEVWRFLRSFVLLDFDFSRAGSRDSNYVVSMLQNALQPEQAGGAPRLWDKLLAIAGAGNPTAGSYDAATLREHLLSEGFVLSIAPDCRADLRKLGEEAEFVLREVQSDIAGLELNRATTFEQIQEKLNQPTSLLLVGQPGAGKSALWKSMVRVAQGQGPVLVLSGDRLSGPGWNGYARLLNLQREMREILIALSGSARPTVFVDGLDRVADQGLQKVINDLLRGVAELSQYADGERRWRLVATARDTNLQQVYSWLDSRSMGMLETFLIPELEEAEIDLVVRNCPRLRPLLGVPALEPILKNPFMFSLLADPRITSGDTPLPPVASEVEVCQVWWQRVVGLQGGDGALGISRQNSLLQLGELAAHAPGSWLSRLDVTNISSEALDSLRGDRILLFDEASDRLRVRRDPLEEWVLFRVLNARPRNLNTTLASLEQPLGLSRSVQLLGAFLLEHFDSPKEWSQTLSQLEGDAELAPRWRQAMLTAPLVSTRSSELLQKAEPVLLSDDGRLLIDLLAALRTIEVEPNSNLLPLVQDEEPAKREAILMRYPVPRVAVWQRLLLWLVPRVEDFPVAVRPEVVRVFEMWQRATSDMGDNEKLQQLLLRPQIADIAFRWLEPLQKWRDEKDDLIDYDSDWD